MRILFIGDIVGSPGRRAIRELLPVIVKKESIDFVIANGENAAGGSGITVPVAQEIFKSGVDILTSGDHIWKRKEAAELLESEPRVLRPLNYPPGAPGSGSAVADTEKAKIAVINLVGRVFMQPVECPFRAALAEAEKLRKITPNIFVDLHAEATSEKIAMGWYLDGKITALLGTHTHVQTADEKILPNGTAYISDAGMTGPFDSVIGRKKEQILTRFITQLPTRFEMADQDVRIDGVIIDFDEKTGIAHSVKRLEKKLA